MRLDKNFRQDFIAACAAARGRARRQEVGPQGELLVSLNRVTVGGGGQWGSMGWAGGIPRWSARPLGNTECRTLCRHLRNSCWFMAFLYPIVHNCPNCTCMQLFSIAYSFFVFFGSSRHLFWCKPFSRGPQVQLSQDDIPLTEDTPPGILCSVSIKMSMITWRKD